MWEQLLFFPIVIINIIAIKQTDGKILFGTTETTILLFVVVIASLRKYRDNILQMIPDKKALIILDIMNIRRENDFPTIAFTCKRTQIPPKEHNPAIIGITVNESDESSDKYDISKNPLISVLAFSFKPVFFRKTNRP